MCHMLEIDSQILSFLNVDVIKSIMSVLIFLPIGSLEMLLLFVEWESDLCVEIMSIVCLFILRPL